MSVEPGFEDVSERLTEIRQNIADAARRAGRHPSEVRLLAVSKGKPAEAIRRAYEAGQREFGENYAQELCAKAETLRDLPDLRWHAIGSLQRNKVKQILAVARTLHAVDRLELVGELERRAALLTSPVEVLVEVNVAGEASKAGCTPQALGALLEAIAGSPHLKTLGLMTIPPPSEDPEAARPIFAALRELRDKHGGAAALPELSMGMTHDYDVAIAEGATIVRIGTAIFGPRT